LRLGLVQLGYLFGGFLLGLALPTLDIGPRTSGTSVATLLFTLAGAVITPASVVFSLLFLVGQFGATTLTPRLTLFRDDPLVWNSFGMFLGFHRPAMGELRVVLLLPDWDDYVSAASYDVRTQISPITCAP
jgi:uncharacterized membrane protein